nr:hypothetical protein CFP56_52267 [Quercus suber]
MSISISTRRVLEAFQPEALGDHSARLQDELGRFRIWAGNVSAHRPKTSRRSLEYRLRDASTLQERVLSLLQDLQAALASVGKTKVSRNDLHEELTEPDLEQSTDRFDDHDSDDDLFEVDDEEPPTADELLDREIDEVHEIVNCLMRFSIALRNPARHDQVREGSSTKWFEPYGMQHVKAKFPQAPEYLVRRLGKAISRHRQYFNYRREHHEKLTEGLDPLQEVEERPSTIATSLRLPVAKGPLPNVSTLDIDDAESVATATSYAGTESGGESHLRPPPWPEAGQQGLPFECPICYGFVEANTERSWQYVISLAPYSILTHIPQATCV